MPAGLVRSLFGAAGAAVSSADYTGTVLVVNFWYATCGPCIIEAPRLERA